jgi:hypothetical protein
MTVAHNPPFPQFISHTIGRWLAGEASALNLTEVVSKPSIGHQVKAAARFKPEENFCISRR